MSVHKELLVAVKDVEILKEVLFAYAMRDTKYIMMIQPFVLV